MRKTKTLNRLKLNSWDALFYILLLGYTCIMFVLFNNQAHAIVNSPTEIVPYISDMPDYIREVTGEGGDYSFPYRFFFWISKLFAVVLGARTGTAVAATILNTLSVIFTHYYFRELLIGKKNNVGTEKEGLLNALIMIFTFSLYFVGCLCSFNQQEAFGAFDITIFGHRFLFWGFDYWYRCQGVYTPNPFWNATYIATRPFAVVVFFEGIRIFNNVCENRYSVKTFCWRESIWFAVALALSTFTKPSYTMIFLPSILLFMIVELIISKGKSFQGIFAWCLTMLPTAVILLYEFGGVFLGTNSKGEETGIGFSLGPELGKVWKYHTMDIRLSILLGMALPIGVLVLNFAEFYKNAYYRFAWLNYLVATAMFLCLYEKGFRESHANFSWGYMHGMFFVYTMTFAVVIKNIKGWLRNWKIVFLVPELGVFAWHMICGVLFFVHMFNGGHLGGF